MKSEKIFRVCYFGTYREEYSRNRIMIDSLRSNGVDVRECHQSLWKGEDDRVTVMKGGWKNLQFWKRLVLAYVRLLIKYLKEENYDVMVIGYPGQFDVYLARVLSWLRGKPLVWDVFMSVFLIASERGLERKNWIMMNLLRWIEWLGLRLPDLLIQDTPDYVTWFCNTYGLPADRFRLVPTGADDRIFKPIERINGDNNPFRVVYYGTFIPNHGVSKIIEAARLLEAEADIHFELIGSGPELPIAKELVKAYDMKNVAFLDWLDKPALVQRVGTADLLLGAFGNTPQSLMTVQNKIYEGFAMKKPVISGDSPTVRSSFEHRKQLFLVDRDDPASLADAILTLKKDPQLRRDLACEGYKIFKNKYSLDSLGLAWKLILLGVARNSVENEH